MRFCLLCFQALKLVNLGYSLVEKKEQVTVITTYEYLLLERHDEIKSYYQIYSFLQESLINSP